MRFPCSRPRWHAIPTVVQTSCPATDGVAGETTHHPTDSRAWNVLPFTVSSGTASVLLGPTRSAAFFRLRTDSPDF